jgi:multicomponent Na+:H+ antiporter subunit F
MSADLSPVLGLAINLVMAMLSVGLFLAFVRLVRGPSLPDRVVALDLTATLVVGIIVVYNVATRQPALLDVALVMALVGFLGAVAFAYYVERGVTA